MSTIDSNLLSQLNGTSSSSSSSSSASSDPTSADAIQNRFLTMLTTQLKAQDPLNPTDTSQMTAQLAQISTVSGLSQVNKSVQQMVQSQLASQSLSASNLIGHQALVSGNKLQLQGGNAVTGAINLAGNADSAQVDILNAQGTVVDSLTIKSPVSGITNFSWDGTDSASNKLPDGAYTFRVKASQNGKAVQASTMAYQTVSAVTMNQGSTQVIMQDGSKLDLSAIQQVS